MAEWRDREMRAGLFNANQQGMQDQARLQKAREDAQNLNQEAKYQDALAGQKEATTYERGEDAQAQKNFEAGLRIDQQNARTSAQNASTTAQRTSGGGDKARIQSLPELAKAIQSEKATLKAMQENFASDEEIQAQNAKINGLSDRRDQWTLELGQEREGFDPLSESNTGGDLNQRVSTIMGKLDSNGYSSQEEAINEMAQVYVASGYGKEASLAQAKKDIQDNGYFAGKAQTQTSEPTENEYPNPIELAAKKLEYKSNLVANESSKKEQNKSDLINAKEGQIKIHLGDALSVIGDASFADKVSKSYGTNQDSVIKETISKLEAKKKTLEDKINGKGFLSISTTDKQDHDDLLMVKLLIGNIKDSVEDYKKQKQSHGK
jgi:hypothetical protein